MWLSQPRWLNTVPQKLKKNTVYVVTKVQQLSDTALRTLYPVTKVSASGWSQASYDKQERPAILIRMREKW